MLPTPLKQELADAIDSGDQKRTQAAFDAILDLDMAEDDMAEDMGEGEVEVDDESLHATVAEEEPTAPSTGLATIPKPSAAVATISVDTPADMLSRLSVPAIDGDPFVVMKTRQNPYYKDMSKAEVKARRKAAEAEVARRSLARRDAAAMVRAAAVAFAKTLVPTYRQALRDNWPAIVAYAAIEDGVQDALYLFNGAVNEHVQSTLTTAGMMAAVAQPVE